MTLVFLACVITGYVISIPVRRIADVLGLL